MHKPLALLTALAFTASAHATRPDCVVTFNELHYHPADEAAATEWVEIHNQMAVDIALDRWSIDGGIDFNFPDGTIIPGGGYLTIAKDPALLPGALGPFTGSLDNGGERLDLINNSGRLMDRFSYGDSGDWPVAPDGSGATLAKRNPNAASGPSRSWTTSLQLGGTPSNANFPPPGLPIQHDLVSPATTWRYDDSNTPAPTGWTTPDFDDDAWPEGEAPLGTSSDNAPGSLTVTAGLVERFRASALTGVSNGATFSTWPDTATGDGTSQNATAGGNPTFQTNATPSGKPAVRFDGNDEFRTSASPGIDAGSGFVYFVVCKGNAPQNSGGTNDGGGAYIFDRAAAQNQLASLKAVGGAYGVQKRFDNGSGLGGPVSTSPISTTDFQIVALRRNTAENRFEIWVDGVLEGTEADPGTALTPDPINIGRHSTIAAGGFNGDIAELLIYDRELSENDFQAVGAYLESEYGLDTEFAGTSVKTGLAEAASTVYLRKTFNFTGDPSRTTLRLDTAVADGAAVYLNGTEIFRTNLPDGDLAHSTLALTNPSEPLQSGFVPVPSDALVNGQNTLAVRLHRAAPASETFFTAQLAGTETPPDPDATSPLVLNEIPGANTADDAFYIEIKNTGTTPTSTAGYSLAVSSGGAARPPAFPLPVTTLAPGETLAFSEAQLTFRPASGDRVFLYGPGNAVADAQRATNRLRGRSPDHPGRWLFPAAASPGTANPFTFNSDIVINEIHYNPAPLQASGPSLQTDPLFTYGHNWRYNESGENLGPDWASSDHPVAGNWGRGPGVLAFETGLPLPIGTTLSFPAFNDPYVLTYYFETDFTLTEEQAASIASLSLTHLIDDGAVFYLNGVEIFRVGMPDGPVDFETLATPANGESSLLGPVAAPVPPGTAVAGTNRLSVEVHQNSPDSSDIVFGLDVGVTYGAPARPFRESDQQWVELYNRGDQIVDIGGWSFAEGIDYIIPLDTVLAPGEHIVVAKHPAELRAKHPAATVLGPFDGNLARDGEDIRLRDASNNPADTVRYFDSGRWPLAADGRGSSLELRDPDADNNNPGAWAASDESGRSTWRTYTYSGTAAASRVGPDNQWREFVFGLLTRGEVLIDDLTVLQEGTTELIGNGDFESGADGFRLIGNHRHGGVIPDPDNPGNHVLRIVATGPTEHMHNHIETDLVGPRRVTNGRDYTVSFRAKWISGSPQLHTRLYFNRLPKTTIIDTPSRSGTPGAANTAAVANAGPTFSGATHSPAVPAPGEPVTVSVQAADPDGVDALTLFYSVGGGDFASVPMTLSGKTYSATLPGQARSVVTQFYVRGTDNLGAAAFFPAAGPDSRAAVKADDGLAANSGAHNIRIVMTPDDRDFFYQETNVMSNDRMPCTVIVNESEIFYGTSVRIKGSERARTRPNRVGFNIRFGSDQLFRGTHRTVAIDRSEGQNVGTIESLWDLTMTNAGGAPAEYNDLCKVLAPDDRHTSFAALQLARFGAVFLDSQFENGADGTDYEYELIYYPTSVDRTTRLKRPQPDSVVGSNITDLGDDKENYRWTFNIKNNRERDDYEPIMRMAKHFDKRGAAFHDTLHEIIDVEQWLRALAFSCVSGAGDSFFSNSRHNGHLYALPDGRVLYFPHDIDFAFNANRSITENSQLNQIIQVAAHRRSYYGHLYDICSRVFNRDYMQRWTTHYGSLVPGQNYNAHLSYINSRSRFILGQIDRGVRPVDFAITTDGGDATTTPSSPVTLEGTGWVDVRTVRLAGSAAPLDITWTSTDDWTLELPVAAGESTVTLEAYDLQGELVATDSITVTNATPSLELASATNIAISEIHYNPSSDDGSDETHEFIELMNISPDQTVDLTGAAFTDGITYTFPAGTTLDPGARLVLARDPSTYPGSLGPYTGALDNAGETLTLTSLNGPAVRSFDYDDWAPWPDGTDGGGPSLVLVAPRSNPDHAQPQNWRASTSDGGNPGTSDTVPYSGGDLLTYALGQDPRVDYNQNGNLTFSPTPGADDAVITPQWSTDLLDWQSSDLQFISPGNYTFAPPPVEIPRVYFRLHVQQRR